MPFFSFTFFLTKLIKSIIFSKDAFFELIKKLQCLSDIFASPKVVCISTLSLISAQTFFIAMVLLDF